MAAPRRLSRVRQVEWARPQLPQPIAMAKERGVEIREPYRPSSPPPPDRTKQEEGWPRREACPVCGYPSGHAPTCSNR